MEDFPDSQGPPAENNVALIPQDKKKISYVLNQHELCGHSRALGLCMTFGQACEILGEYIVVHEAEI